MAKEPGRKKSPSELRAEIARSREAVGWELGELRSELDIPRKIRRSFQNQPGFWIAGIAVVGLLVATRFAPKKKVYVDAKNRPLAKNKIVDAGLVLGALRIAVALFKPAITRFVAEKVRDFASSKSSSRR